MDFEEFFAKKRIDLSQLKADNRVLYAAFRDHYAQMGEKSFDHTKKFWFNRLRKTYLLKEIEPEKTVSEREGPLSAMNGDPQKTPTSVSAPAAKPVGFKPRFKAAAVAKPIETKPEETKAVEAKPEENAGASAVPVEEKRTEAAKPVGFKPRFKAAAVAKPIETKPEETKAVEAKPEENAGASAVPVEEKRTEAAKPAGFKPRFRPGITKTIPTKDT